MDCATRILTYNDTRLVRKEKEIIEGFIQSKSCSIHKTFKAYNIQKSCYRFFENTKVTESILIDNLKVKCAKTTVGKDVLVILDTTTVCIDQYKGRMTEFEGVGIISSNQHTPQFGFLAHPLYVVDEHDGTPYGIADVILFNRSMEANKLSVKERKQQQYRLPLEEKESSRWLAPCIESKRTTLSQSNRITFVMDREADMWEIYDRLPKQEINFVTRLKNNRRIEIEDDQVVKVKDHLSKSKVQGRLDISYKDDDGISKRTSANIKWSKCKILAPKHKKGPSSGPMYCIEVQKKSTKGSAKNIHWILWTNHEVTNLAQAKKIIEMYVKRWGIEVFFKLLKSDGYNIENCQLEKGSSIRKLLLIIMDAATKVLQLKAARLGDTSLKVRDVFTEQEVSCLLQLNKKMEGNTAKQKNPYPIENLAWATWIIARLAGWKDFYSNNNPPGNKTLTMGLESFNFLFIGYSIAN